MKKFAVILLILTLLTGLNAQSSMRKVSAKGLFSISIPATLKSTTKLNKLASVQYYNPSKEMYVIVIDESISDLAKANLKLSLGIYFKMAVYNIITGLKNSNVDTAKSSTRGNLRILQTDLEGKLKGNDVGIYYKIAIAKSPTHFYQIFTWTLSSQKFEFGPLFQQMIDSFSESQ
jgi:hypothetical protein